MHYDRKGRYPAIESHEIYHDKQQLDCFVNMRSAQSAPRHEKGINMILNSDEPVFLMCPPDFYTVEKPDAEKGSANEFEVEGYKEYSQDPKGFAAKRVGNMPIFRGFCTMWA